MRPIHGNVEPFTSAGPNQSLNKVNERFERAERRYRLGEHARRMAGPSR